MAQTYPVVALVTDLGNGKTVSTSYDGARYATRVVDGVSTTVDQVTGEVAWPDALRTHASMVESYG